MARPTTSISKLCLCRHWGLLVLLLAFAATACSGGSSKDDESESSRDAVEQPRSQRGALQPPVTPRRAPAPPAASDNDDGFRNRDDGGDGNAQDGDANNAADEVFDPDALIRRLDRLVSTTDARMLRTGVAADATLSFDALEERLKSTQAQLRAGSPATPVDIFAREEHE